MKLKHALLLITGVAALYCSPNLLAQTANFQIDLDTTSLVGAPNSPFFLDFQLNKGNGTLNNTATLTNFVLTGGTPNGSANLFGNASGNLSSSVTLSDSSASPFNEFYQGFTAGTTHLKFNLALTQNSPGATPDEFSAAILDSEGGNPQITTNAPDTVSLVVVPIGSSISLATVKTYSSTSPAGVTSTAAAVPEPSSMAAFVVGLATLIGLRFKRADKCKV